MVAEKLEDALRHLHQGLDIAVAGQLQRKAAIAHLNLGIAYALKDEVDRAISYFDQALTHAEGSGAGPFTVALAHMNVAELELTLGLFEVVERRISIVRGQLEKAGRFHRYETDIEKLAAELSLFTGRDRAAREAARRAYRAAFEGGNAADRATMLALCAACAQPGSDEAAAFAEAASGEAKALAGRGSAIHRLVIMRHVAVARLRAGDPDGPDLLSAAARQARDAGFSGLARHAERAATCLATPGT